MAKKLTPRGKRRAAKAARRQKRKQDQVKREKYEERQQHDELVTYDVSGVKLCPVGPMWEAASRFDVAAQALWSIRYAPETSTDAVCGMCDQPVRGGLVENRPAMYVGDHPACPGLDCGELAGELYGMFRLWLEALKLAEQYPDEEPPVEALRELWGYARGFQFMVGPEPSDRPHQTLAEKLDQ